MRTTITIDDHLLREVQRRAAARSASFSDFVQEALRAMLSREEPVGRARAFKLVTFGRKGPRPGIDLDRTSAILETEDVDAYRRRR